MLQLWFDWVSPFTISHLEGLVINVHVVVIAKQIAPSLASQLLVEVEVIVFASTAIGLGKSIQDVWSDILLEVASDTHVPSYHSVQQILTDNQSQQV